MSCCGILATSLILILTIGPAGCDSDDDIRRIPIPNPVPDVDYDPAWSPDGSLVAFYHFGLIWIDYEKGRFDADPDSQGIWLVSPDGTDKRMLLRGAELPAWSPDAHWLAVVHGGQIWKLTAQGDSVTQLTTEGSNLHPSWSPDGQWIASSTSFCTDDHPCGIWITHSDGSRTTWLSKGSDPDWSPDGESLLFTGSIDDKRGLLKYNLASSLAEMIYELGDIYVSSGPEYSPDGHSIAVGLGRHVWIMNADGTNARQLCPNRCSGSISWSPDGSQIVYAAHEGLWVINSDGTNARQLTFPPESRDGVTH